MQITVSVIKTNLAGIDVYKPDYSGNYKVILYSSDKTTCLVEIVEEN